MLKSTSEKYIMRTRNTGLVKIKLQSFKNTLLMSLSKF